MNTFWAAPLASSFIGAPALIAFLAFTLSLYQK